MKPGDFGMVRTGGFAAACIRLGTRSPVNHAFIYVGDGRIVEGEPSGAVEVPLHYDKVLWSNIDLTDAQRTVVVAAARAQVGLPYNWWDIACLTLSSFGLAWRWAEHRVNALHKRICSQLVACAWSAAGVELAPGKLPAGVTPADLLVKVDGL